MCFGHTDLINHQSNTTLRNDIRDGVSQLDVDLDRITLDAEHGEDVDDWVGTPRNDRPDLNTLDKTTHMRITFTVGGITQSDKESLDDVTERDHGSNPKGPTSTEMVTGNHEFTGIAKDDHESRCDTQCGCLRLGFIG